MQMLRRRVVITGMGVIAPNGQDLDEFWRTIRAGESAADTVTRFDIDSVPNKIACEIRDFQPERYFSGKKAKRFELSLQYGIAATKLAIDDAGIRFSDYDPDRVGIIEGTSVSGMESTLKAHIAFLSKGYRGMSPYTFINAYCGGGSGEIALEHGIMGHATTLCTGSSSGNDSIGQAWKAIVDDEADLMVAGGSEAPLVDGLWSGFCVSRVMTRENDHPKQAMKPFDKKRDGFVLGEGAGYVVLEELSHALARGARIYAEILGHGRSCEAYNSVSPHPDGIGLVRALEKAIRHAAIEREQVDYINLHGTATGFNDVVESKAVARFFGNHSSRLLTSSTKPVTGHLLGGAGGIETIVTALSIARSEVPPTANLTEPDEGCKLDYIAEGFRRYPVKVAINLNSGFGGKNSCIILGEYLS